jgi:hypothetical protein
MTTPATPPGRDAGAAPSSKGATREGYFALSAF